jgi:hypothetical protein
MLFLRSEPQKLADSYLLCTGPATISGESLIESPLPKPSPPSVLYLQRSQNETTSTFSPACKKGSIP